MATNNAAEMIPRIALKGTLGVSGPLNSDYDALINKPRINGNELADNKTNAELGIPTELADLTADADHRTVSDTEKETWNAKSDFSGSYDDLTDVPEDLVEDAEYVHTDNNYTNAEKTKLGDIEPGAEVNVQADWNESDTSSDAYIQNKPTIPAAQVNSDWNASSGVAEILHKPTLGTAAAKDYTGSVLENSTDLVESGAVKTAIDNAISSVYKPAGNKACAELVSALLIAANLGNVYNMTDDGVTTADFVEGAGKAIEAGDNVVIVDIGSSVYKFDLLSGMVDLSNYVQKSSTAGLIKNDGTIDQTAYAKQNEMSVSTNGDQTTIQLKNETTATVINAHQDISGKANKSEMIVTPGTGSDADKTTIQLKSGTDATVLTQHQDISGKVDKEQGKGLSTEDYTTAEKSKLGDISENAKKVASSSTNGHIEIDDVDTTVYDDTAVQTAIENIEDELSTDYATVEGNPINFTTLSAQNAKSTILSLEPIQDLHGFTKPWVGGTGRNLLTMTVDAIKSANTAGTWNGNIYSYRGIDTEILVDNDNNVLGFKLTGTASSSNASTIYLGFEVDITNGAIFSALPQGASSESFCYQVRQTENHSQVVASIFDEETTLTRSYKVDLNIRIASNYTISNALMVYPMVRETTDTDPTFEPYTNICGISGRTELNLEGLGANIYDRTGDTNDYYISATGVITPSIDACYSDFIPVDNGVYTFRGEASPTTITFNRRIHGYDVNKQWVRQLGYKNVSAGQKYELNAEVTSDIAYICLSLRVGDINAKLQKQSNNITLNFGQTVYGGTLAVESGVLRIDRGYHTYRWGDYINTSTLTNNIRRDYTALSDAKVSTYDLCDICLRINDYNLDEPHFYIGVSQRRPYVFLPVGTDDNTEFNICYELDTPTTLQLTPHAISILKGVNNFSTDGDKITLTYRVGEFATLGDLEASKAETDEKIAESQILTDSETGKKYKLVVANGVLDIEEIIE